MTDGESEPTTGHPDATLVARVLDGDRAAFAEVYDRYADRLYDFAQSMLRNPEDAADSVADAFVTFAEKLPQLREPDRLRPWLYAIVRSECLRRIKARGRIAFGGDEQLAAMPDTDLAPDEAVAASALQQLVWDAAGGLSERDRALLDLHLRQGLDGAELGEAMGVSASNAYVMMNRLRGQLERSLGALLVAKTGRDDCSGLDDTLDRWDGEFSPLVRKRVARHVDACPKCLARKAAMASPLALFAGVPAFAAPGGLRERVLSSVSLPAGRVMESGPRGTSSGLRWALLGGVAAAIIALVVFLVPGHLGDGDAPVDPPTAEVTASVSPSPTATPSPTASVLPFPPPRVQPDPDDSDDSDNSDNADDEEEAEDPRPAPEPNPDDPPPPGTGPGSGTVVNPDRGQDPLVPIP